jgi:hypothetical protein
MNQRKEGDRDSHRKRKVGRYPQVKESEMERGREGDRGSQRKRRR